jgi:hypothetical protein
MAQRKFNVGDVVINFESIELWDNVYHFEKTLSYFKKEVVVAADDYCFTTKAGIDISKRMDMDWDKQRHLYDQRDGRQWGDLGNSTRFYGNFTTNEANIRAYLQKKFDAALAKCQENDDDEVAKLEADIRRLQAKLDAVKAGKRPISFKSDTIERDFINNRIDALNKILAS